MLGVYFDKTQRKNSHLSIEPTPVGKYLTHALQLTCNNHAIALGLHLSGERDQRGYKARHENKALGHKALVTSP